MLQEDCQGPDFRESQTSKKRVLGVGCVFIG